MGRNETDAWKVEVYLMSAIMAKELNYEIEHIGGECFYLKPGYYPCHTVFELKAYLEGLQRREEARNV